MGARQSNIHIYTLGNPSKLLRTRNVFRGVGQPTGARVELNQRRIQNLQEHIEWALDEKNRSTYVVRLVHLASVASEPHIALLAPDSSYWCFNHETDGAASFVAAEADVLRSSSTSHDWLQSEWNNPQSDARFAWDWARWSEEERIAQSCSLPGKNHEVEQIMRWVLLSTPSLWKDSTQCRWVLHWQGEQHGFLSTNSGFGEEDELLGWQKWLWAHFFSGWRADWMKQHSCVEDFGNFAL